VDGEISCPERTSLGDLTVFAKYPALDLTLLAAEEAYRDEPNGLARAAAMLAWLERITVQEARWDSMVLADELRRANLHRGTNLKGFEEIYRRARALLSQLQAGLDFFGYPRNFVPLLTLDSYRATADLLLRRGQVIEMAYDTYTSEVREIEDRLQHLDEALAGYEDLQATADEEIASHQEHKLQLDSQVQVLLTECIKQRRYLESARSELQRVVAAAGEGCDFSQVLDAINMAVSVSQGNYASVAAMASAARQVRSSAGDGDLRGTIKAIRVIAQNARSFRNDVIRMHDEFGREQESAKLVVFEDDYLHKLDELQEQLAAAGLDRQPEGVAFKRELQRYLTLVQAKNEKQLELSAHISAIAALRAEKKQREFTIERTRTTIANARDASIVEMKLFFERAYRDVRMMLVKILHLENRAFEYWSLSDRHFTINYHRIAAVTAEQARLEFGISEEQRAKFESGGLLTSWESLRLETLVSSEAFQMFIEGQETAGIANDRAHVLHFQVTPESAPLLRRWKALRLTSIRIRLTSGVSTHDGTVQYSLVHHGSALLLKPSGGFRRYVHPRRKYTLGYKISTGEPTTDELLAVLDKDFIAPSPFSPWTLTVSTEFNPGLSFEGVTGVEMSILGKYLA
jgi:hypothetical protein